MALMDQPMQIGNHGGLLGRRLRGCGLRWQVGTFGFSLVCTGITVGAALRGASDSISLRQIGLWGRIDEIHDALHALRKPVWFLRYEEMRSRDRYVSGRFC